MEILVVILVLLLAIVIFVKREDKKEYVSQIESKAVDKAVELLEKNEHQLVSAMYNKLPSQVKQSVDSKIFADVVEYGLSISTDIIKDKYGK